MREHKGCSLLSILSDYTVIDIETTGHDQLHDSIIELGAIRYRNNEPIAEFSVLVNPEIDIDSFIERLTGITNDMLVDAPLISDVMKDYLEFLGTDIIVGHNVNFDINFIYDNAVKLGLPPLSNDFVDTLRLSRRLFPELDHHRLRDMVAYLNIDRHPSHRSLTDCYATAGIYSAMVDYITKNEISLSDILHGKNYNSIKLKAADVVATTADFDISHPLYGKVCVFTGTLEKMLRKDAMQSVVNVGGFCADGVTKKCNFLILGNNDYCKSIKGGKSSKQKKAEQYKLDGQDIEIISENVFYDMLADCSVEN